MVLTSVISHSNMTGLTVVLTQGTPVLTFASDKDLAQFSANDDVEQDSGYQPITSAITNVANGAVSKANCILSSFNNLAEAITGTFEYDLPKQTQMLLKTVTMTRYVKTVGSFWCI